MQASLLLPSLIRIFVLTNTNDTETMGFVPFTFIDLIDIILVAAIMYWIYRTTKGTNAPYIITGIIVIYLLWVVVKTLNMELLSSILGQFISVGVIALIIVFQPELRRFLQMIGMRQKGFNFITRIFSAGSNVPATNAAPIVCACTEMAKTMTGALIVIGQQSDLRLITEGASPSMPASRHRCSRICFSRTRPCTTVPWSSRETASSRRNASCPSRRAPCPKPTAHATAPPSA